MSKERDVQSIEYEFPYHYLPEETVSGTCKFSREWGFSASWLAAIKLIEEKLEKIKEGSNGYKLNILDVGCGDGAITNRISKKYKEWQFTGIDNDEQATRWGNVFKQSENVSFITGNLGEYANQNSDKYDIAMSIEVIEHIRPSDLPDFIKSIANSLTKDGVLILTVPHINSPLIKKHYQHFDKNKLECILSKEFECLDIYGFGEESWTNKLLMKLSLNRVWTLKIDLLNKLLVDELAKKISQRRCKRLFYFGIKRR